MKKAWWFAVFLLMASVVYAQQSTFTATITPLQQSIKTTDVAQFDLTMVNNGITSQIFEIYSPDIVWDVRTDQPLSVPTRQPLTAALFIRPINVNPGVYGVPLTIRKVGTADTTKQTVFIEIKSDQPPTTAYLPAFRGNASLQRMVEPGQEITISLDIENLNRKNLSNVVIKLNSAVIHKEYTTTLDAHEKKRLTFTTTIDKTTAPQKDFLKITIIKSENGKAYQYELNALPFTIVAQERIIVEEKEEKTAVQTITRIKISNQGNIPKDVPYTKQMGFFKRLISHTNPPAEVHDSAYQWTVHLDVGEERVVSVTTNYQTALIIFALIVLSIIGYFVYRSPLHVKKTAMITSTKDGGIAEMKIHISIKNRSRNILRHINIIDLVPKIVEVNKKFDAGMNAPSNIIKNDKKGALMKWEIADLDPGEEYILTYHVTAKYSILGGATLPVTVAKFIAFDGTEQTTFSNRFKVTLHH